MAQTRRSEEHTSELQSRRDLVCRLLLEKKNNLSLGLAVGAILGTAYTFALPHPIGRRRNAHAFPGAGRLAAFWFCARLAFFFFNETATTEIYTLSLHDALPI